MSGFMFRKVLKWFRLGYVWVKIGWIKFRVFWSGRHLRPVGQLCIIFFLWLFSIVKRMTKKIGWGAYHRTLVNTKHMALESRLRATTSRGINHGTEMPFFSIPSHSVMFDGSCDFEVCFFCPNEQILVENKSRNDFRARNLFMRPSKCP